MDKKLKDEALRRMKQLKLLNNGFDSPVGDFKLRERPWKSEFYGILYYLTDEEKKIIAEVEKKYSKYDLKVYHCYRCKREFGEILYMLFVSKDESPLEFDNYLRQGIAYVYAHNITFPEYSEFGTCYIRSQYGGIVLR